MFANKKWHNLNHFIFIADPPVRYGLFFLRPIDLVVYCELIANLHSPCEYRVASGRSHHNRQTLCEDSNTSEFFPSIMFFSYINENKCRITVNSCWVASLGQTI